MSVSLRALTKRFGQQTAVSNITLDVEAGSFFAILGPSGCGKSTLLRLIAGLETPDEGEIAIGGETVASPSRHVPPEARNVGVVFQSYALWPHMSVHDNVAFPVESAGLAAGERKARVETSLDKVGLAAFAARKPASLSGGQRQRVALARCIAQQAGTILMDEPLANLDPHLRQSMEEELAQFHRQTGATTLYITHDQREAMALADRIAILWEGRLLQAASPETVYQRPAGERVARFIGRSALTRVNVAVAENGMAQVKSGSLTLQVRAPGDARPGAGRVVLRPEDIRAEAGDGALSATVLHASYRGGFFEATADLTGIDEPLVLHLARKVAPGERVPVRITGGWLLPQDG
ncbi:ABC transporter ATP-binding protein [Stappia indica]|uniref:Carbohydrate ABC transporter ATP-binding protein, CUT1 family n=1 Tax=Stappia indica TaxID=538381 RepID=A0A285RSB5_9HYPH|nr:ABC transporter ATP-binding protein [Stappia indica]SOB97091.1 carbohydrate ABC transporter ATP-binding protein, CUT1 family [Stappia indica]